MILTVLGLTVSYIYGQILCMFLFSRMLERRHSFKITIAGSLFFSMLFCLLKIPFFFLNQILDMAFISVAGIALTVVYQIAFFRAVPVKRVLAFVFYYVYMFSGEMLATNVSCLIFGRNEITQLESYIVLTGIAVTFLWSTFGFYPLLCLWELLLKAEHHRRRGHLWLCVLLPFSQYLLMEYFVQVYESKYFNIPVWSVGGIILGILADVYMFFLFYRENRQFQLRQELLEEQELYRREQLYYEHLKESQEETARIRHDYQNYILVLRNMIQKRGDNNT